MIFDKQYQGDIIKQIQAASVDDVMIKDVLKSHESLAKKRMGLYNRYTLVSASNYDENRAAIDYDGVPIFVREIEKAPIKTKVNHRLHFANDRRIVQTFVGYLSKPLQIAYKDADASDEQNQAVNEKITEFLRDISFDLMQSEILKGASLAAVAYALLFIGEGKVNAILCDPWETIVVKNNLDQVQYAFRYWKVDKVENGVSKKYTQVEFYDDRLIRDHIQNREGKYVLDIENYPAGEGFEAGTQPHFFKGCPVVEIRKNREMVSDVEITLPLQDALDISGSDLSSEISQLRLAYLKAKNVGFKIDTEFLVRLLQTGILPVDKDGGDWEFMEKVLNIDAVKYLMDELRSAIMKYSNSVDFSSKDFQEDIRVIGWGIKMKPLEESAIEFENNFFASLRGLFDLVFKYWTEFDSMPELDRNNLAFTLPRNLPANQGMETDIFGKLWKKVSDETALSMLSSIVKNVPEELARIKAEAEDNMERLPPMDSQDKTQDAAEDMPGEEPKETPGA